MMKHLHFLMILFCLILFGSTSYLFALEEMMIPSEDFITSSDIKKKML